MKTQILLLFFGLTVLFQIKAQDILQDDNPDIKYQVIEQMPQFQGGENELMNFIARNIRYPHSAIVAGIQGKVIVHFVITETGKVGKIEVLRGIDTECDKEAIRVIQLLPNFTPGKQNGKNVAVWYTLPVVFRSNNNQVISTHQKTQDYRKAIIILDGKLQPESYHIDPKNIKSMDIIKSPEQLEKISKRYNTDTSNGVIIIKTFDSETNNGNNLSKKTIIRDTLQNNSKTENNQVYVVVEQMPQFPGGEAELMNFINRNLRYPVHAQRNGIQGRVILRFVVSKTGEVDRVEVVRSVSTDCDNEAIRVIKSLPKFIPARQKGINVSVWYTLPITFKLK